MELFTETFILNKNNFFHQLSPNKLKIIMKNLFLNSYNQFFFQLIVMHATLYSLILSFT